MTLPADFLSGLENVVGPDRMSRDPDDLNTYGKDWTRVVDPAPSLVVFPATTQEVSKVLTLANEHQVAIVPSGGRTGLAGGAVASRGEVVLSLEKMRRMDPVDTLGMTVRVQAGAVTESVHQHVQAEGLSWPVDFASKGSSQIGGNISTNAGGVKVIRYGGTRQWVLGLQVVLASGEVLELNGALEKNNSGLDLRQLFIGTEGTLGVITEATLKLTRIPERHDVFVFAVQGLPAVLRLFEAARRGPFVVSAFEFFNERCLARVKQHRRVQAPVGSASHYVLLETEGHDEEARDQWLEGIMERELVIDGTMAQNREQGRQLWELREGISESLSATGLPAKNDIALPLTALGAFCDELERVFAEKYPGWEICLFGHIGDGNLHVNVMKPADLSRDAFFERIHEANGHLFALVEKHRGSISAEHGIGLLKKPWLETTISMGEIDVMRRVKQSLDPNGILNPGKIFD